MWMWMCFGNQLLAPLSSVQKCILWESWLAVAGHWSLVAGQGEDRARPCTGEDLASQGFVAGSLSLSSTEHLVCSPLPSPSQPRQQYVQDWPVQGGSQGEEC